MRSIVPTLKTLRQNPKKEPALEGAGSEKEKDNE
jgi:hypothetical protein